MHLFACYLALLNASEHLFSHFSFCLLVCYTPQGTARQTGVQCLCIVFHLTRSTKQAARKKLGAQHEEKTDNDNISIDSNSHTLHLILDRRQRHSQERAPSSPGQTNVHHRYFTRLPMYKPSLSSQSLTMFIITKSNKPQASLLSRVPLFIPRQFLTKKCVILRSIIHHAYHHQAKQALNHRYLTTPGQLINEEKRDFTHNPARRTSPPSQTCVTHRYLNQVRTYISGQ